MKALLDNKIFSVSRKCKKGNRDTCITLTNMLVELGLKAHSAVDSLNKAGSNKHLIVDRLYHNKTAESCRIIFFLCGKNSA